MYIIIGMTFMIIVDIVLSRTIFLRPPAGPSRPPPWTCWPSASQAAGRQRPRDDTLEHYDYLYY